MQIWSCHIHPVGWGLLNHLQRSIYVVGLEGGSALIGLVTVPAYCSTITGSGFGCLVTLGF